LQATFLPSGYPDTVAPGYLRNTLWQALHHTAGSANGGVLPCWGGSGVGGIILSLLLFLARAQVTGRMFQLGVPPLLPLLP